MCIVHDIKSKIVIIISIMDDMMPQDMQLIDSIIYEVDRIRTRRGLLDNSQLLELIYDDLAKMQILSVHKLCYDYNLSSITFYAACRNDTILYQLLDKQLTIIKGYGPKIYQDKCQIMARNNFKNKDMDYSIILIDINKLIDVCYECVEIITKHYDSTNAG